MKYLVTGAEGFIGSQFMEAASNASAGPWEDPPIEKGDVLVHLGALAGIGDCIKDPRQAFTLNTADTVNLLEAVRDNRGKMIFASSSAAANPLNPYAASKASSEAWCRAYRESYNVPVSILRFANVYGPGSMHKTSCVASMCKDALTKGVITVAGGGYQERDFVYVGDVVDALLDAPFGGEFSVRTGAYHKVYYVANKIASLSGAEIVHGERPKGDADRPRDAWPQFPMTYTPLDEGIERTWEWFSKHA
jgi:UDP-glucose 4-epimerase